MVTVKSFMMYILLMHRINYSRNTGCKQSKFKRWIYLHRRTGDGQA